MKKGGWRKYNIKVIGKNKKVCGEIKERKLGGQNIILKSECQK